MTDTQRNKRPARRPDCVTETRIGNTILVVSGFFKEGATDTAADKICPDAPHPPAYSPGGGQGVCFSGCHVVQSRYGIVGLAVGNGGIYVKTDHPATHYRPLPKTVP